MQKNKKEETFMPFHHVDKEKERRKKESFWVKISIISLFFTITMFIISINQDDNLIGIIVFISLFILGIISLIISGINFNKYTNKEETIRYNRTSTGTSVTCPYCKSINTKKITNTSKAVHTAIFGIFSISRNSKEWHCNGCGSDF